MRHKDKAQAPMRFRGFPKDMPVLETVGPADIVLSKNWVARGVTQRIGATIIAIVFLLCSVALFAGSLMLRSRTSEIMGGVLGQMFGITLTMLGFLLAFVGAFLAMRLLVGVGRSFRK